MARGCNPQHRHPVHDHQNCHVSKRFLPALCRSSINDVKHPKLPNRSITRAEDPSSPKVSCIGQVKKRSNSRVSADQDYTKLSRLFSSKSLTGGSSKASSSCRTSSSRSVIGDVHRLHPEVMVLKIEEMDPPLPVVRRGGSTVGSGDGVNLWRRRRCNSNGFELKSLQIQKIHVADNSCGVPIPPSTL